MRSIPGSLRSDEPIQNIDQDEFSRTRLIEVIGKHILAINAPEAIIIALNAPWGAGKSSCLNLIENYLQEPSNIPNNRRGEEKQSPPIIVRFNPWHYANVDQLIRMFFDEIARAIGTAKKQELGKKIGALLRATGSMTSLIHPGIGGFLKEAGLSLIKKKSLPEIKSELNKLLPNLGQRVVVIVDDIDRLERDALRMLFRMIRLNADFPYLTYVLAFDRLVVERNLDEKNGVRGRDYLEKIIQVSFDVPTPEPSAIIRILFAEMNTVLGSIPTRELDKHRWGNIFHSGFKEHFRTIRHIKRYVNGLRLTLNPVSQEVDLADFFVIELIRIFHPEIYKSIVRHKDLLVPMMLGDRHAIPTEQLKKWVEDLCEMAGAELEKNVQELLRALFPELGRVYNNMTYGHGFHSEWRRECRICSREVFDKYFLLAIPEGEISEVEVKAFVDELENPMATKECLRAAKKTGKARRMLDRLQDYTRDFPIENVSNLVGVLFDEGDDLRFESQGMLDSDADWLVPRIIFQCLSRLKSEEERHGLLLECVKNGASLYTVAQEVLFAEPTDKNLERPLISDHDKWTELRDAAVVRIESALKSGQLWSLKELPYVLFRWHEWAGDKPVQKAVKKRIADDSHLVPFLSTFITLSYSHGMHDRVSRTHRRISKKDLEHFVSIADVKERLRRMIESKPESAQNERELLEMLEAPSERPWKN